ncbi:hypothetical protein F5883DRAFT_722279 [Diaporthe sp. PMI_573]|nr:hypothetical protein F5883DRAFT_722279 [Diaporthaceae sp. PMI_573]
MESTADIASRLDLRYQINHLFLLPKTPQKDDIDPVLENELVASVLRSLRAFREALSDARPPAVDVCLGMLRRMLSVRAPGTRLDPEQLEKEIRQLRDTECLLLHLRAQNAGLLVTASTNEFVFEAFELLAANEYVTSCTGRLIRQFPGPAVAVDRSIVTEDNFLPELAYVLCKLDIDVSPTTQPKTKKAGKQHAEERDTVSPILVTSMLVGLLRGLGRDAKVARICKRSREQVNWDNARLPWHRCACWLLLRVGLRLVLDRAAGATGRSLYKPFIVCFLGSVLQDACRQDPALHPDTLYAMNAKVVRRLHKLNPDPSAPWLQILMYVVTESSELLKTTWKMTQHLESLGTKLDFGNLGTLRFDADTTLSLVNLEPFFGWVRDRVPPTDDEIGSGDTTELLRQKAETLPSSIPRASRPVMSGFRLIVLEAWVTSHLDSWRSRRKSALSAPEVEADMCQLRDLIESYHAAARTEYEGNPESLSRMYLTMTELWAALDERACADTPLLQDYNPGFPTDLFHRLILPRKDQMMRLCRLEAYLARRTGSGKRLPFEQFGALSSFAVRYFNESPVHQQLLEKITVDAENRKQDKLRELKQKKEQHAELTRIIAGLSHKTWWDTSSGRHRCNHNCPHCNLTRTRDAISIHIFEWPLPCREVEAKAAVFEISVPEPLAIWREVTLGLLAGGFQNAGRVASSGEKLYFVSNFDGLRPFVIRRTRVEPASTAKPFTVAHYRSIPMWGATPDDVCKPHGCDYKYYDCELMVRIEDSVASPQVPGNCSFAAAVPPPLSDWIASTAHSSNDVIAAQSACPTNMRLDAFRAFGHLRAGVRIQWLNLLCELLAPALDFDTEGTWLLVLQSVSEAGPSNNTDLRVAHEIIQVEGFSERMVGAMATSLGRIEKSWEHAVMLAGLVVLATRLLSLAAAEKHRDQLSGLCARLRRVASAWAKKLLIMLGRSTTAEENAYWSQRVLFSSLTCIATFDADTKVLARTLALEDEAALLAEASMLAREYLPASGRPSGSLELVLFHRWQWIAYETQPILSAEATSGGNGYLDRAVKQLWPDCPASNEWVAGGGAQKHVLRTTVPPRTGKRPMQISYNILTGGLFVNGFPLRTLPSEIRETADYRRLFDTQSLSVMPSAAPQMQFSSAALYEGFEVHLAMISRNLVVRAVRAGRTFEYIPPCRLEGDFPASFVSDFAHWLSLDTLEVEFRPIQKPWISSPDNWTMRRIGGRYFLAKGGYRLVDPRSPTARTISNILLAIESAPRLHLVFERGTQRLQIDLPRIGINFFLYQGDSTIKSKQYGGMCIDEDQHLGSLIGFRNKLVLCRGTSDSKVLSSRKVLLPQGTISYRRTERHVEVSIATASSGSHYVYVVDDLLGRLVDSGTLQSKLLLAYLHALTSHCLPDLLTGRTGTEEALRILRSAAVLSFPRLDERCREFLGDIAALSPVRHYYPEHLSCMERTEWSALPPLSQHEDFYRVAQKIMAHAADCELFWDGPTPKSPIKESQDALVRRAVIRNSTFRVSEFGAEEDSTGQDREYLGRADLDGLQMAYRCTVFLDSRGQALMTPPVSDLKRILLNVIGSELEGPSAVTGRPVLELRFDVEWLTEPADAIRGLWCRLDEALSLTRLSGDKYRLMFFFAGMVFAQDCEWEVVQLLLAKALVRPINSVQIPNEPQFNLEYGWEPCRNRLATIVEEAGQPYEQSSESSSSRRPGESHDEADRRRLNEWHVARRRCIEGFVQDLQKQHPCKSVLVPHDMRYQRYIEIWTISDNVRQLFLETYRNHRLDKYIDELLHEMSRVQIVPIKLPSESRLQLAVQPMPTRSKLKHPSRIGHVTFDSLLLRCAPATSRPPAADFSAYFYRIHGATEDSRLAALLNKLKGERYIEDLRQSSEAHRSNERNIGTARLHGDVDARGVALLVQQSACHERVREIRQAIDDCLQGTSIAEKAAYASSVWPRVSAVCLLQRLSRHHWNRLSPGWKQCIANYALAVAYLQQAERLVDSSAQPTDLLRELTSSPHTWDILSYPESLLLEVEQGLLIRKVQDEVASEMREPRYGHSSVVQLNMGEGKSSVIVPIVAAALADGSRLVRCIVGKPQSKQMEYTLVNRLGGLLNRRVFFLPFSRSLKPTASAARQIQRMLRTCREEGGVLLVQPEHLLSFQLMGLEYSHSPDPDIAARGKMILDIHDECGRVARDIVDESDENFSVRFELVYTMGSQQPVDHSPDRWTVIQAVLQLVRVHVKKYFDYASAPVLFEEGDSGGFPMIRILEAWAGDFLLQKVAQDICSHGLKGFPIQHQSKQIRRLALDYMVSSEATDDGIEMIYGESAGSSSTSAAKTLLLLRGLFSKGILDFCLRQKRYRVHYGLALKRRPPTMLAVPYRAKDSPAPRSEFSHPDVVIVLTCLSYYYGGLSNDELSVCFEHLSKSDRAEQEYDGWAREAPKLDASLRYYSAINVKDRKQCLEVVFPALRYGKSVVDFYLSTVVFPREMKEFPLKLSASGWDLAKRKTHPLTGFSGTNDSKYVLPLPIRSLDLREQQHTNAAVLECLIGDENCVMEITPAESQSTTDALLAAVVGCEPKVQVILDVGAQIIQLDNRQMAEAWLRIAPEKAEAAIFFNNCDELLVLTRNGMVERFLTSSFSNQTDRCLVFLDQEHTRGTDLRLPDHFRAAVTLGPKITKDALAQASMRMRKLGKGQSVVFCAFPEMQHKIRARLGTPTNKPITVSDVLGWSIYETWDETLRSIPLWATQGIRHQRQSIIWDRAEAKGAQGGLVFSAEDINDYLEDEAQTLEQRYRRNVRGNGVDAVPESADKEPILAGEELRQIKRTCDLFEITTLGSVSLQEEQERELATEVEEERQVERPAPAKPSAHSLHPDVRRFVRSGIASLPSQGIIPVFRALERTSAAQIFAPSNFDRQPQDLLATVDFARTVVPTTRFCADAFQRSVQWILAGSPGGVETPPRQLLILSPWEADRLLPEIRISKRTTLHLYRPRGSLSFPSLEDLMTFTLPAVPRGWTPPRLAVMQLNLFAGQLYLNSYEEYIRLCKYLGVSHRENTGDETIPIDGFIGATAGDSTCTFASSPLSFLDVLYKRIRGDELDMGESHLGKYLFEAPFEAYDP